MASHLPAQSLHPQVAQQSRDTRGVTTLPDAGILQEGVGGGRAACVCVFQRKKGKNEAGSRKKIKKM
jgi:hypothetical protein